jgi:hypothetical protein
MEAQPCSPKVGGGGLEFFSGPRAVGRLLAAERPLVSRRRASAAGGYATGESPPVLASPASGNAKGGAAGTLGEQER